MESIPSIFYQGNPGVKEIAVSSPGRPEREAFLDKEQAKWSMSQNPMYSKTQFADFVDATDGFSIRDLIQLARLSQQTERAALTIHRLLGYNPEMQIRILLGTPRKK